MNKAYFYFMYMYDFVVSTHFIESIINLSIELIIVYELIILFDLKILSLTL